MAERARVYRLRQDSPPVAQPQEPLEQEPLWRTLNISLTGPDCSDPKYKDQQMTVLKTFLCPSDLPDLTFFVDDGGMPATKWRLAHSSYVACNGTDGADDFTTQGGTTSTAPSGSRGHR